MSIRSEEREDVVYIENIFEDDDGNAVQLDGKGKPDLLVRNVETENIIVDTKMTKLSDKKFAYNWQTTKGTRRGEYLIKAQGSISGDTVSNKELLRIDDVIQNG